jgi:glyoxylase-like metal-dependent hydrolase (beta-lactamase superfamily II)
LNSNPSILYSPSSKWFGLTSLVIKGEDFAVVGDTLFNNGIGRTDLYRGDYETLVDSIKDCHRLQRNPQIHTSNFQENDQEYAVH